MALSSRRDDQWLHEHLDEWVSAGIVSTDQACAIAGYERTRPAAAELVGRGGTRLPLLAEAISYLGIILVLASGAYVVGRF